jgi:hypothetical protein
MTIRTSQLQKQGPLIGLSPLQVFETAEVFDRHFISFKTSYTAYIRSRDSAVGIVTGCGLGSQGVRI